MLFYECKSSCCIRGLCVKLTHSHSPTCVLQGNDSLCVDLVDIFRVLGRVEFRHHILTGFECWELQIYEKGLADLRESVRSSTAQLAECQQDLRTARQQLFERYC